VCHFATAALYCVIKTFFTGRACASMRLRHLCILHVTDVSQSKAMQETSCFHVSVFNLKEILTFFAFFAALRDQDF